MLLGMGREEGGGGEREWQGETESPGKNWQTRWHQYAWFRIVLYDTAILIVFVCVRCFLI